MHLCIDVIDASMHRCHRCINIHVNELNVDVNVDININVNVNVNFVNVN